MVFDNNSSQESLEVLEENFVLPKPILSDAVLELHRRLNLTNPGHMGKPVILPPNLDPDIIEKYNKSVETYQFNEFVSTLIPLDRELPDIRSDYCKQQNYSKSLPVVSVVLILHNEAVSMILRTIYSILNRSPPELIGEIILVDDCSSHENLKKPFDEQIAMIPKVKIIRSPVRIGLMKARMFGAVNAKGPALIFMDSHMEAYPGWLEPLLDRLVLNKNSIAISRSDNIVHDTLESLCPYDCKSFLVTGLTWDMRFSWKSPYEPEAKKRKHHEDPIASPTMLGAFFVIYKEYFEYLGMYDEGFQMWGVENIELPVKAWLCGGRVEIIPCSHVSHLYRPNFPYKRDTLDGSNGFERNADRFANVWLDDHIRFYHRKSGIRTNFGDISKQKKLREDLKCKSFQWFIDNVYPDIEIPDELKDPKPNLNQTASNQTKQK